MIAATSMGLVARRFGARAGCPAGCWLEREPSGREYCYCPDVALRGLGNEEEAKNVGLGLIVGVLALVGAVIYIARGDGKSNVRGAAARRRYKRRR